MRKWFQFFLASFFSIFLLSCGEKLPIKTIYVEKKDGTKVQIYAEIAKAESQRARGFMFRKRIKMGTGMLFVFEKDEILSFWMKNTPHALDIAYVSSDGTIKDIFPLSPLSLDTVKSTSYCRYALEVPKGYFEKAGITVGDRLLLPND